LGIAGRVWPRHGHRGRPLNAIVRAHMTHGRRALIGAAIAVGGSIPLLIYIAVGPKDGNPIGLGLLMCLAWLIGAVLVGAGAIGFVVSQFTRKGN
jgi:hypothetical protein